MKVRGGGGPGLGTAPTWISHEERPLQVDELYHALAVELGSTDFDVGNIPSIPTLVSCCQALITVDKEALTMPLIHFTLQEYLSSHPNIFNRPRSAIAAWFIYDNYKIAPSRVSPQAVNITHLPTLNVSCSFPLNISCPPAPAPRQPSLPRSERYPPAPLAIMLPFIRSAEYTAHRSSELLNL